MPGDSAGYPVTIDGTAGGSYRLTSNLIVPDEFTSGIVVGTSDIGIDLNNFTIIRSGCEGVATDCTPAWGTGAGILAVSTSNRGISVKNGSITGMGSDGVSLGEQAEVTRLRVRWNRVNGIAVFTGSTVSGNTVYSNDGDGIQTGFGATVQRNSVRFNGGYGLNLGSQSAYRENVITNNTAGTVNGGVNMFSNSCNGTTTCP